MPRLYVERSAGHAFKGDIKIEGHAHSFTEVTDLPAPAVVASRPVHFAAFDAPDRGGK